MNPFFLQTAVFITGCAGIVAEYVLSTLATYLLGNSVFQWTMIMSLMLFAMGIGSRASRYLKDSLFDYFLMAECLLSVLCALSAIVSYSVAAHVTSSSTSIVIYIHSMFIGALIGMEIPLVTRINDNYTSLRVNISSVMEKDYYGALLGGIFFVFIALPYFGLTYTPAVLGSINLIVALMLITGYFNLLKFKKIIVSSVFGALIILVIIFLSAKNVIMYSEQKKYTDKIIYQEQTKFQKIVITQWKNNYWLYLNGQEQFSTYDEQRYHESLVHPAVNCFYNCENVLILGGGDGLAAREVLKYKNIKKIDLVDLDPKMTELAKTHPVLTAINKGSMNSEKINIINSDGLKYLEDSEKFYDVIIIDFPDPDTMDLMHLYSRHFYEMVKKSLSKGGIFVTQASSPYFTPRVFLSIEKTIQSAGFETVKYHQGIPTMGDWGFICGAVNEGNLQKKFEKINFSGIQTRFLNNEILNASLVFGKDVFEGIDKKDIRINTKNNPVLYKYYNKGRWEIY